MKLYKHLTFKIFDEIKKTSNYLSKNKLFFGLSIFFTLILAFLWLYEINRYGVNVLFWDHWDLYFPPLDSISLTDVFMKQHGTHRQGIAFVITKYLDKISGMNIVLIMYVCALLFFCSGILYYLLSRKINKSKNDFFDIIIFLIVLNPNQIIALFNTPNMSHGPMPAFLVSAYCLIFLIRNYYIKNGLLLFINFQLIFSAFGFAIAPITILLYIIEIYLSVRQKNISRVVPSIIFLLLACLPLYIFMHEYQFTAHPNFVFPYPQPQEYIYFIMLNYAKWISLYNLSPTAMIIGGIIFFILVVILFKQFKKIVSLKNLNNNILPKVIFVLIGFSLIFLIEAAIGRVCFPGYRSAGASRYMPYLVPSFIGLYLYIKNTSFKFQQSSKLFFFIALIAVIIFSNDDLIKIKKYYHDKKSWSQNYLRHENISEVEQLLDFKIYPIQHLITSKINYLKENKLNFFYDDKHIQYLKSKTLEQVWDFKENLKTFSLSNNTYNIRKIINKSERFLLKSDNTDPHIFFRKLPKLGKGEFEIEIKIISPKPTRLEFFYLTKGAKKFSESKSIKKDIKTGINKLRMYFFTDYELTGVRLDPGFIKGNYELLEWKIYRLK